MNAKNAGHDNRMNRRKEDKEKLNTVKTWTTIDDTTHGSVFVETLPTTYVRIYCAYIYYNIAILPYIFVRLCCVFIFGFSALRALPPSHVTRGQHPDLTSKPFAVDGQ